MNFMHWYLDKLQHDHTIWPDINIWTNWTRHDEKYTILNTYSVVCGEKEDIGNIEIIKYCQEQFDFHLPSVLIARRTTKFLSQIAGFNS